MTDVLEPRAEPRRRRKAERPQEILEAAFAEFSRNGYATTTLEQIAERAGVTKGTIYVYFENKEHLFISVVREVTMATLDTVRFDFAGVKVFQEGRLGEARIGVPACGRAGVLEGRLIC